MTDHEARVHARHYSAALLHAAAAKGQSKYLADKGVPRELHAEFWIEVTRIANLTEAIAEFAR